MTVVKISILLAETYLLVCVCVCVCTFVFFWGGGGVGGWLCLVLCFVI